MNWGQLKKSIGHRVQLVPVAKGLDIHGGETGGADDDWIIVDVSDAGVRISNSRTDHFTTLGKDHIFNYSTNPDRSRHEIKHGFLTLNVQIFLQGSKLSILPSIRPGCPVKAPTLDIIEKWVDLAYPVDSGLQQRLESEGYCIRWCVDSKLARRIDLEGWERVVERDASGKNALFRVKDPSDNLNLIMKSLVKKIKC